MEKITAEHIIDLAASRAVDPALVRYDDGSLEVRSLITRGSDGPDNPFERVVERDGLYDLAPEWDGGDMDDETAALVAEQLN